MQSLLKEFNGTDIGSFRKATVFAVAENLFAGAPLFLLYVVIAAIIEDRAGLWDLLPYIGLMVLLFGAQALCSVRSVVASCLFAYGTGAMLRLRLGEHLRKLPLGYFTSGESGQRAGALLLDVFNVELAASTMYNKLVACIALPLIVATFMACINFRLTLLLVITVPPALYFLYLSRKALDKKSVAMLDSRRRAASRVLEYIQGIRTIRSFNLTGSSFARLDDSLCVLRDRCISLESHIGPVSEIYACIAALGFVLLILFGTQMLQNGTVSLPILLLFMIMGLKFYQPIMGIAPYFSMIRHLTHSAENIQSVLNVPAQTGAIQSLPACHPEVRFENVRFSYGDREVLQGISFSAEPRSLTALVGPSGAGKTTIANLLARFWDVDSGKILVDGQNVRDLAPEVLLGKISMVMQDAHLFHDTVLSNIRFGNPKATEEEVMQAAKEAHCHDFISSLPQGYGTVLGEGGATLSGGEKKRIAIARAILKNAPIVILDEATASLDPENEGHIQEAFSALVASKTIFAIAHKLSTIRHADQILFIDDGRIVEQGDFEQLMAQKGRFAHFWELQQHAKGWKIRR